MARGRDKKPYPTRRYKMNKKIDYKKSPWITHRDNSAFGYEMSIAEDKTCHSYKTPHPLFSWIDKNGMNTKLFEVLATFCPLHPLISYHGETSVWLSPPYGIGNVVGIICGRDENNNIRIIGSNSIFSPNNLINKQSQYVINSSHAIFNQYDLIKNNTQDVIRLISSEIYSRMDSVELARSARAEDEAYKFSTVPIHILVIDGQESFIAIDTAVVTGNNPSNLSLEFTGEIL